MKQSIAIGLLMAFWLGIASGRAQPVDGFWLGVTYPTNPNQAVLNYAMNLTQTGNTIGGTSQTSDPNLPFNGIASLSGKINGSTVTFSESDKNGSTAVKDICFWRGTLAYNPADESLIGTFENIVNGTTCTKALDGRVELYRIVQRSGSRYCSGSPVDLVVTGKNIRWYASSTRTKALATGNTYSPKITQTTTFYITQTLYQTESPAIPITVEIVEPVFKTTLANTSCSKTNSSIEVTGSNTAGWQYSLNGGAFQTESVFTSLSPGSYTVVAKDAAGCQAGQVVTVTPDNAPTISQLISTPPKCETANGTVNVVVTGGRTPMTYSIDYGKTYQSSAIFSQLPGGIYTLRARDANGCETNRVVSLPESRPFVISSTGVASTSCGQANGRVTITGTGGTKPIQYSLTNQPFQASNTFTGLSSGTYTVVVRDSAGCTTSQPVLIAASAGPPPATLQLTPEGCGNQDGTIVISPVNTVGLLEYSLDSLSFQSATSFSGLSAGTYTLTTRDDRSCLRTQAVQIPLNCPSLMTLPTAFSPNADHINDALTVYFRFSSVTISQFTVFDRWGTVVYNRANFALSTGEPIWDGQLNGQAVPAGMYTIRLDCVFPTGVQMTYRQSVAVISE